MDKQIPKLSLGTVWHIYQPPTQKKEIVDKVTKESYLPVSEWLSRQKDFKVNININSSLTELLVKHKHNKVIENLARAAENGTVEFTGTAAYHPLLPLIIKGRYGKDEVKRQIELNDKYNSKIFGKAWKKPRGFYPPEFAFSPELAEEIKKEGFEWAVTDAKLYDASNNGKDIPHKDIGTVKGLPVFFITHWSLEFAMTRPNKGDYDIAKLVRDMQSGTSKWFNGDKGYLTWGYDGETIGHHHKGYSNERLDEMVEQINHLDMGARTLSEILDSFDKSGDIEILPGSQSSSVWDIQRGEYFPLWKHRKNILQQRLWDLQYYAIEVINETEKSPLAKKDMKKVYDTSRDEIDRGLYSCKSWWANPNGNWDHDMIYYGTDKLMKGISGCYFILKQDGRKIEARNETINAGDMIEKAKKLERAVIRNIDSVEIKRGMDEYLGRI